MCGQSLEGQSELCVKGRGRQGFVVLFRAAASETRLFSARLTSLTIEETRYMIKQEGNGPLDFDRQGLCSHVSLASKCFYWLDLARKCLVVAF